MDFEIWRPWAQLVFREPNAWEYSLLAIQSLLGLGILVSVHRGFMRLGRRLFLLVGCLVAPFLSEHLLVLRFSGRNLLPPLGFPVMPPEPFSPIFGALPIAIAGAWLGPGPAVLVGLVKGILRAGTTTGCIAEPFHLAPPGFLIGFLLRQNYRGRLPFVGRQPVVAMPLMLSFSALLRLVSSFAQAADSGLAGFDYAMALTSACFPPALVESLIAALAIQVTYLLFPRLRPVLSTRRSPPNGKTPNRRPLFLFVPLIGLINRARLCCDGYGSSRRNLRGYGSDDKRC